jgi:hypothetical protein
MGLAATQDVHSNEGPIVQLQAIRRSPDRETLWMHKVKQIHYEEHPDVYNYPAAGFRRARGKKAS